jgi:hypothetical protein
MSFKNKYVRGEEKFISKINAAIIKGLVQFLPTLAANSDKEFNIFKSALNSLTPFNVPPVEQNFHFDSVYYSTGIVLQ